MRTTVATYQPGTAEAIRVVKALMLREIKTRFGEHHLGFVWLFIEPLLFIVPVIVFWSFRGETRHGLPLVEFLLTGYPPFVMWRHCVSRSRAAISGNSGLLYHRMVTPARIVLARCLLEIAASILTTGLIYIVFLTIGWVRLPANFPYFLLGWIYMGFVSWACAIFLSAISEVSMALAKVTHTVNYLMLAIGGVFYMVEWMPTTLQKYIVWIPTVQGFELIRFGYFGDTVPTHWEFLNMIVCLLIPAVIGMHVLRTAREHLELE